MQANPFFSRHAAAYAASASQARGADLLRLVGLLAPEPGMVAADVATGAGHTALALAEAGCRVTGIDPTPSMLAQARRLADGRGLADRVRFLPGVAEALPLADGSVDLATCRRAAHHFLDIPAAVREMVRVLRPAGRLGLADICPEAPVAGHLNRLERLRDPTHVAALDEAGWRAVLQRAGLRLTALEILSEEVSFEAWLAPVAPDGPEAAAIRAALAALPEPARAALTGGAPGRWVKRRAVLVADRRA